jgi:RNA polymerase sigma factor (sigma-70 family)
VKSNSRDDETDGRLVHRFAEGRDEQAFAELLERHGALVAGVCARMMRNREDAEDAFQAVFLVLARRANAVRRSASLAGWLHNVAVRVCLNERRGRRRRQRQLQEAEKLAQESIRPDGLEELKRVIDEELAALPARLREVLVLCDLGVYTQAEAARALSLPVGTVSSRLTRGREALRKRLVRHGLPIAVGGFAASLGAFGQAAPAVTAELVRSTVNNAHIFLFGTAAAKATLGIKITTLAEGVLYAMIVSRWKVAVSLIVLLAITLLGGTVATTFVPGLVGTASAATLFFDDFEDGSLFDGKPVSWRAENAMLQIQDESLIVSGTGIPRTTPLIGSHGDVSIKARARLLEGEVIGFTGRRTPGLTNYHLFVQHTNAPGGPVNEAGIGYGGEGGIEALTSTPIPFDPRLEDFNMQLDIFGNEIRFWVWRLNESRPIAPLGTAVDNRLSTGEVEVYAGSQGLSDLFPARAAFRYVHVADMSIPEPSGAALAAVGGVVLASGLFFRQPRFRHFVTRC